ncbi:cobalt ECF transporter T component CbiQ [Candidatus Cyanaurora vandensis]|uniref:cobalt ECF transporter T component CbiQ n=1 Tax=Candidatus Cyanaurora vandensis TaxID=2714958 RepID=UPI002580039F|nr:cobalt ECF transporter T component CbiQ [Candidatus Cyanaurora vandensis]
MLLHVPTFSLAAAAYQDSPWHRLAPRARLGVSLILVLGVAVTPARLELWGIYALFLLLLIVVSQVSPVTMVKRLGVELVFVGVLLLSILWSGQGTPLVSLGVLQITQDSLARFGGVLAKALLSLVSLNLLTLTTPAPRILQALEQLRFPRLLVRVLELMLRFLAVLVDELGSMKRAAQARRAGTLLGWGVAGNILGSLFLRTYGRGERVHLAMQARGFKGSFQSTGVPPLTVIDGLAVLGTVGFVVGVLLWQGVR